ncbi:glycoside hydrolase family 15 protein [uncultured Jannaschia sp.]|uniref:glycoside hydrolase family 15 protein n=1 Tax=uncultured Jannaschia sp. TaxID=293347 RepID=UPI0026161C7C|nr:glycoside hydrolase family 15 protein [uncultured Jannaschia sp.]
MSPRIEDYAMIGDGHSAALVRKDGSIDWLCWPRFDSDACFAALLGTADHGRWRIAPAERSVSSRRYRADTLILETEFETEAGAVRVTDFMPMRPCDGDPAPTLVRLVRGLRGVVEMALTLDLRFDYGSFTPWLEQSGDGTVTASVAPHLAVLRAPVELIVDDATVRAGFEVAEGTELAFVLRYGAAHEAPPGPIDAANCLRETDAFWTDWIGRFDGTTDWPDAVRRSLITLKAMIHRPTGGIVAAPSTSLPEVFGGRENWDYRYAWLRDSTFTLRALLDAGYEAEAREWTTWLLRAVAGDPDKMRIAYHVDGARRLEEWEVDWLPGFRWSSPVRVGNAAAAQLQLDIYGEVMDTLWLASRTCMDHTAQVGKLEEAIVDHVAEIWREPDQGLWETRGRPRHYVYSKVMCWVAVDRCARMSAKAADLGSRRKSAGLAAEAQKMHDEICREGFDADLGHFTQHYGSQRVDASLLLLPLVGFLPVSDERIAGTIAAVEGDLAEDGLVRRNDASDAASNAFLACSCWLADCQALQGRTDAARKTFERFLSIRNDVGLLSEQFDPHARRMTGNFPQALSHLALVRTALSLSNSTPVRSDGVT